jgi:hypothetical protein
MSRALSQSRRAGAKMSQHKAVNLLVTCTLPR